MKKFILQFLFLLLTTNLFSQSLSEQQLKRIKEATVYIQVKHNWLPTEDEYTPTGSGFFISDQGHLITNYHVIQSSLSGSSYQYSYPSPIKEITIITKSGSKEFKKHKAFIIAASKKDDIALLQIQDTITTPFLQLDSTSTITETQTMWIFGYPYGESFSILQYGPEISATKGIASSIRHNEKGIFTTLQLDAGASPGNSGGPVVNEKGEVIAIISSILRDSKLSFGIPIHYISTLLQTVDLNNRILETDSVKISFNTEPQGAAIFVDFKKIGTTPLKEVMVKKGFHNVYAIKKDYYLVINNNSFIQPDTLFYKMDPINKVTLPNISANNRYPKSTFRSGKKKSLNDTTVVNEKTSRMYLNYPHSFNDFIYELSHNKITPSKILKHETFTSEDSFSQWKQLTGSEIDGKSSWFIEDGILTQFEDDNTLRVLLMGDSTWSNYAVNLKTKIPNSRASSGVVFRSTDEGFYLFTISRGNGTANLLYHSNKPFGWFSISENVFDFELKDNWYNLSVIVNGNNINCFIDTNCVLSARSSITSTGNVGVYSFKAKCQFDSLTVTKLPENLPYYTTKDTAIYTHMSLDDNFNEKSTWWYPYTTSIDNPQPWYMLDAGCAQLNDDEQYKYLELSKYNIANYNVELDMTTIKGTEKSNFIVFYKKSEEEYYTFLLSNNTNKIILSYVNHGEEKILKERKLYDSFFDNHSKLNLKIKENGIQLYAGYHGHLKCKVKEISKTPGYLTYGTSKLKVIFHDFYLYK